MIKSLIRIRLKALFAAMFAAQRKKKRSAQQRRWQRPSNQTLT